MSFEAAFADLIDRSISPPKGEEINVVRDDLREALEAAEPFIAEHHRAEEREKLQEWDRQRFGALGLMLRENQGAEERSAENYEKGHARRLMHEGKASAFRFAAANLRAALKQGEQA